ncbi:MAG: right-handed parallel beta-helix repeat-containing protein [Candidatus Cloacimonetes bacterium]|nr:right-handed parallel beta-helix repeat-containing protein [Candidatus Cloacimonadota bacterium]
MEKDNRILLSLRQTCLLLLISMTILPAAASADWTAEITSGDQLEPVYFGYTDFIYDDQITLNDEYVAAPQMNKTIMRLDDLFSKNIKSQNLVWKFSISTPPGRGTEIAWNVSSVPSNVCSVTLLINGTMVEMRDASAYRLPPGYYTGQIVVRYEPSILYVDGSSGANYTTIQDAVDAAFKGDIIIVMDGVYNETVRVTKGVTIVSENGAQNTALHAYVPPPEPGTVTVGEKKIGFEISANNVTIKGFQVYDARGTNVEGMYGGIIGLGDYCTISDNIVRNNAGGISVRGYGLQITNNTVTSNTAYGITVSGSGIVKNNTISENVGNGLSISGLSYSFIEGNRISWNSKGIFLASGMNQIAGNTIENNTYGLFFQGSTSSDFIYTNNILNNNRQVYMNSPSQTFEIRLSPPMSYRFNNRDWPPATLGNYWGRGTASGSNGVGTRAYTIPYQSRPYVVDKYPLVGYWDNGVIGTP